MHYKDDVMVLYGLYREVITNAINFMFKFLDIISFNSKTEKYQEIQGIAEVLGLPNHEVMLMNYLYELDAYCTTLVARLPNGTLVMERNLDFYFPNETRTILYLAKFYRNDKFVFEAPMFAGTIGVYTGHHQGGFALAINERTSKESGLTFMANLGMIFSGYEQIGWFARQILQECTNYECALAKM